MFLFLVFFESKVNLTSFFHHQFIFFCNQCIANLMVYWTDITIHKEKCAENPWNVIRFVAASNNVIFLLLVAITYFFRKKYDSFKYGPLTVQTNIKYRESRRMIPSTLFFFSFRKKYCHLLTYYCIVMCYKTSGLSSLEIKRNKRT